MYTEDIAIKALKAALIFPISITPPGGSEMRSRHPETIELLLQKLTFLRRSDATIEERGIGLNAVRSLGSLQAPEACDP